MNNNVRAAVIAATVFAVWGVALAKLPPPPPMDDKAKAAAEEKKAKDAAAIELQKQLQAKAEDRVAARYIAEQKAKGKVVTPQMGPTSTGITTVAIGPPATAPAAGAAPAAAAPAASAAPAGNAAPPAKDAPKK